LLTNYGDRYLGDPMFVPLFEELNRRSVAVYVHPMTCACDLDVLAGLPASMIEFPHSTTRAIASLFFAGAFERYANIRFIFSHEGGTLPSVANRISAVALLQGRSGDLGVLKRLYYDTAGPAPNVPALTALTKFVTSKQIVFGSDFPFGASAVKDVLAGLQGVGFSASELDDVEWRNASALFPRLMA
jgi:predicted TIM-barrel fold metal-dependent hydrolase